MPDAATYRARHKTRNWIKNEVFKFQKNVVDIDMAKWADIYKNKPLSTEDILGLLTFVLHKYGQVAEAGAILNPRDIRETYEYIKELESRVESGDLESDGLSIVKDEINALFGSLEIEDNTEELEEEVEQKPYNPNHGLL